MRRREFLTAIAASQLLLPLAAWAQGASRMHRIGLLRVGPTPPAWIAAFRKGLQDLGHVEGQSLVIELGLAGSAGELPDLAADLIRRKVVLILASGTPSVMPAKNSAIPVVFVAAIDPVAAGVASSLARPGGNVTGVSAVHADVTGKRLQLLQELLPRLSKVALLVRAASPATAQYVKEAEEAARTLGLELQVLGVRDAGELDSAVGSAQTAGALLVADDAVFTAQRTKIAELALANRLATIYGFGDMVEAGGLMAYGPHYGDLYRRAATHVHKILQGAKPADLAIEQPTRFEMVVNLKTAKTLGLELPPAFLARADQVIE
jgi:putative ABC transport system substrate-binding protein